MIKSFAIPGFSCWLDRYVHSTDSAAGSDTRATFFAVIAQFAGLSDPSRHRRRKESRRKLKYLTTAANNTRLLIVVCCIGRCALALIVQRRCRMPSGKRLSFAHDKRRKHHHWRVIVIYPDGEIFARVYTDQEKAKRFAERQRKSPVVQNARIQQMS